jgi:hypothetical protein
MLPPSASSRDSGSTGQYPFGGERPDSLRIWPFCFSVSETKALCVRTFKVHRVGQGLNFFEKDGVWVFIDAAQPVSVNGMTFAVPAATHK